MQNMRNLRVWHEARELVRLVFLVTRDVSSREFPGQASQLRRASTSVGANIAEGTAHRSQREFARYLQQALASAAEVEHHALIAIEIGMLEREEGARIAEVSGRVQRMLVALHRRVTTELPNEGRR